MPQYLTTGIKSPRDKQLLEINQSIYSLVFQRSDITGCATKLQEIPL